MIALLIDNNTILRTGFHTALIKNFENIVVLEADSVETIKTAHGEVIPDLIVFAQQDETEKIDKSQIVGLRNLFDTSAIIVCDYVLDISTIRNYFKLGVNGCISKKVQVSEFIKCIHHMLDGKRFVGEDFQALILSEYLVAPKRKSAVVRSKKTLTPRESQIAAFLSDGHGTSWIARKLEKKPSTISTIKHNIFKKLGVKNIIELRNSVS